ncbi:FAD-dependent oxidoreductase, partial [Nocardioides stalactiti]|uniref:FAD-dependent oxidoreductase n=1 Tax=Nocardioides stalactiti TaxID=2755356 RepID=UPI0016009DC5
MSESIDVAVIGLGPGGEHVAAQLAKAGLTVLGVEKHLVGGECPYYGCIPSKMMIRAADALAEARRVPDLGGTVEVTPDWGPVARRISDEATDAWNDQVAVDRLVDNGGRFARGHGRLAGPGKVVVETADGLEEYDVARAVVLNVGT